MLRFYGDNATSTNEGYRAASYTMELRDTGEYGFILPPDQVTKCIICPKSRSLSLHIFIILYNYLTHTQIIPNGQEVVPAALYLAEEMMENPIHSR